MATNLYGDISRENAGHSVRRTLKRGKAIMVAELFGQIDPQGKNKTRMRSYRRYLSLPLATEPLAEGIPPEGQSITFEDIEMQLEQYGDLVKITDVIEDTHTDPVLKEAEGMIAEQAAETSEYIRLSVMKAGTNVFYAGGVASRALVTSKVLINDFNKIYRSMRRNKAKPISKILKATHKIATEPVAPAFFALAHTDLDFDIRAMTGFVPVEKYSDSDKGLQGEIGKCGNTRFILTEFEGLDAWKLAGVAGQTYLAGGAKVGADTKCDVYPILVIARDAYAIVPMAGQNAITPAVHNAKVSPSDPLGQNGFVSWKRWDGAVILNHGWLARYEAAATAL